jgi:two-component system cell cycle response regulator DivK
MEKTARRRSRHPRALPAHVPPKLTVLVVDDFPDGLELVSEYLKFRGFDVHVANSGKKAIKCARTLAPDIVLMDLMMPGIDGWRATRILKNDQATRGVCVIAMTAHALKTEVDSAMAAGCDGVICKPFDLLALANALPHVSKNCAKALNVPGLALPWTAPRTRTHREDDARGHHHAD